MAYARQIQRRSDAEEDEESERGSKRRMFHGTAPKVRNCKGWQSTTLRDNGKGFVNPLITRLTRLGVASGREDVQAKN